MFATTCEEVFLVNEFKEKGEAEEFYNSVLRDSSTIEDIISISSIRGIKREIGEFPLH
ncbi:MAG: hypothetical protein AMQ74_01859 [Candidatus Methanofastidiosum methylothiophilum]|uniref:Uncharacterized protein n=1 Tax=Candidatus Methanofastidiosum methylothiophilum TaxID=1705564 RepID=A0A150ING6_9EURY|nr:MAG: hypothetical protein AMQ74_01859 [Candidatus Methanofastidiosum methylthiophilus]